MTTDIPERIKLDFYALGKTNKFDAMHKYNTGTQITDYSNNILERNALSLNSTNLEKIRNNFKTQHSVTEIKNKETNNYLNPISMYRSKDIYKLNPNLTNKETFNVLREKYFANDKNLNTSSAFNLSNQDFIKRKNNTDTSNEKNILPEIFGKNSQNLKENTFFFDKSTKKIIRYQKGFWDYNEKNFTLSRSKISSDAPDWFHLVTKDKQKKWDDEFIKKGESLSVLSRYQKWITVTPKNKNRHKPLEKIKNSKKDETSKIMPSWMQIQFDKDKLRQDEMKSEKYDCIRDNKKFTVLVDKNLNEKNSAINLNNKSIFSIGDFRHNMTFKKDMDSLSSKVSHNPKQFFDWDDGTKFNPKYKKDKIS